MQRQPQKESAFDSTLIVSAREAAASASRITPPPCSAPWLSTARGRGRVAGGGIVVHSLELGPARGRKDRHGGRTGSRPVAPLRTGSAQRRRAGAAVRRLQRWRDPPRDARAAPRISGRLADRSGSPRADCATQAASRHGADYRQASSGECSESELVQKALGRFDSSHWIHSASFKLLLDGHRVTQNGQDSTIFGPVRSALRANDVRKIRDGQLFRPDGDDLRA